MGFELSHQRHGTLHRLNKLYLHRGPCGVAFFAGWVTIGIVLLKLWVVWASLLHKLRKSCDAWFFTVALVEGFFLPLQGFKEVLGLGGAKPIPACCLLGLCFMIPSAALHLSLCLVGFLALTSSASNCLGSAHRL